MHEDKQFPVCFRKLIGVEYLEKKTSSVFGASIKQKTNFEQ